MANTTIPPVETDIVFICGALRSGTTLLRLMVNHHPQLSSPGEMDFLFEPPHGADGRPDMREYERRLQVNRVFSARGLKFREGLDYVAQVRDFAEQLRTPGKRLTINVHRHFDRIPTVFPEARYVHLVRDPRDVGHSAIGMGWAGNAYSGVDHWINSERDFERLAEKAPNASIFRMKNEDLIRSTEAELGRLCAFLGVDYDAAMLSYPSHTTYSLPDPKLVEQWRKTIAPREVALIEHKLGAMLEDRGYARSDYPAATPGDGDRFLLRIQNTIGRWRFSLRRNGLALTLADIFGRRLKIAGLEDFARRRRAEIAARHVK